MGLTGYTCGLLWFVCTPAFVLGWGVKACSISRKKVNGVLSQADVDGVHHRGL